MSPKEAIAFGQMIEALKGVVEGQKRIEGAITTAAEAWKKDRDSLEKRLTKLEIERGRNQGAIRAMKWMWAAAIAIAGFFGWQSSSIKH